jgi:hypothetical protein
MSSIEMRPAVLSERIVAWFASGLGFVGVILPIFAGMANEGWIAPVALVIPPVCFMLMLGAPEAFGITNRRTGRRSLNIIPALSVVGLIAAASHVGVINWRLTLLPAGLCAAMTLLLGLALVGRRLPGGLWLSLVFWACFGGAYGYGAMVFADMRFDQGATQTFPAPVQRQYLSYNRNSTTPHLVLGPWGEVTGETDIAVSRSAYDALGPGQTACVTLHPGRLGMPWFQADVCGPD